MIGDVGCLACPISPVVCLSVCLSVYLTVLGLRKEKRVLV